MLSVFIQYNSLLVGSETCILSINRTSINLYQSVKNEFAKTFVWKFPCYHSQFFSYVTLIVIPSPSKMVGGVTYVLFTTWLTGQQVNQTFNVASKTMTFFSGEASKFVSNTYALTNLTPRTTTPSALYLFSTGCNLDLTI